MAVDRLAQIGKDFYPTGEISRDAPQFFAKNGLSAVAARSARVAREARHLADILGADTQATYVAGWLHSLSRVIPLEDYLSVAEEWGLDIFTEERMNPPVLHQRLSVVIAQEIFDIQRPEVLSAIRCHATLRAQATESDKIVFLADKIRWERPGVPPYLDAVQGALDKSLDEAVLVYLDYALILRQNSIVHPWMMAAYEELRRRQ